MRGEILRAGPVDGMPVDQLRQTRIGLDPDGPVRGCSQAAANGNIASRVGTLEFMAASNEVVRGAKRRFSYAERYAVWLCHGPKCSYCTKPLELIDTTIDHHLLAVALPMFAADPAGFQMWTSSELQTRANALKLNEYQQGVDRMENWGNHAVILERLEGATPAEAHEIMADLFVVTSGETMLTVGGIIVDPVNTTVGEPRGKSINGGVTKKLAAGDIVHIPAKMPHRLSVEAGKVCTYLVLKVRME
jgi:mannose-6-phosphate isomerase-like protein (cupin superfamily)